MTSQSLDVPAGAAAPAACCRASPAELSPAEAPCGRALRVEPAWLWRQLRADPASGDVFADLAASRPHLFASSALLLPARTVAAAARIVSAVETVAANPAYVVAMLAGAPAIAAHDPGSPGAFMSYDFHLTATGPRLIEVNTNAGGGLLSAEVARAQRACCSELARLASGPIAVEALDRAFLDMFANEWRLQGGAARPLTSVAIVDDDPPAQFLHAEFRLFERLFQRFGVAARIVDAAGLERRDGRLWHGDFAIDLVYNRLTDFAFAEDRHAALRQAYLAGEAAVTPHPRAHALRADKRALALLSDADVLRGWGVAEEVLATLATGVPRTVPVEAAAAERLWAERGRLFFKPAAGYGSKAAYRGDKLTRRAWNDILAGRYVAQALVPPSEHVIETDDGIARFKLDLRCYVYGGCLQFVTARLYQGQTTNFRTPGGGFAPVFYPAP